MAMRERLRGLGEVDIVKAWYEGGESFDLKPAEDAIRKRWELCKALFLERKRFKEIVETLMADFGISIAQARNDVRNMKHVFGDLEAVPKSAHRERAREMALAAYEVAQKAEDSDGMTKATKVYALVSGLEKEDTEPFDIDRLMKDRMYVEVMDPQLRSMLLNMLDQSGGVLDTSLMFEHANKAREAEEFTDYELIPEENQPAPGK
jgi:hypothetical protein